MRIDAVPRWLGWLWVAGGVLTALGAVVGVIVGWALIGTVSSAVTDSVGTARRALQAVDDTTRVVDDTFDAVASSLRGVQITLSDTSLTLTQASAVTRSLGGVVTEEVPDSVAAVRASLPGLIRTAGVIDATMRGLSFFGVDYDPAVPLDESIAAIDAELEEIPALLRAQQGTLEEVAGDLAAFSSSTIEIGDDIASIRVQLAEASTVLSGYGSLVTDGTAVLDDLDERVGSSVAALRVVLILVGLGLVATQSVPIAAGLIVDRAHRASAVQ